MNINIKIKIKIKILRWLLMPSPEGGGWKGGGWLKQPPHLKCFCLKNIYIYHYNSSFSLIFFY
jgi:hypothetical protein